MTTAAVVTIGFFEKSIEPVKLALKELLRLSVHWIIIVFDKKSKNGADLAHQVYQRMFDEFDRQKKKLTLYYILKMNTI